MSSFSPTVTPGMTDVPDTVVRIPIGGPSADIKALMELMVLQSKDQQEQRRADERARDEQRNDYLQQRREDDIARDEQRRADRLTMEEHRREDLLVREASTAALKVQNDLALQRKKKPIRMGVDIPQLAKLDDPQGITLFLDCFRREMLRYAVPSDQWTALLLPLLDKKSASLSRQLPLDTQTDLDLLSKELLLLHGISPDFHRRVWSELRMSPSEDALQYAVRVSFAMKTWIDDCSSKEEAGDRIATDKFISGLDRDTAQWTRNHNPSSCMEAGRTAALYMANQRIHLRPRQLPATPNATPRTSKKMTPEEIAKAWDPVKGPRCFKCDVYGHVADDCPKKKPKPTEPTRTSLAGVGVELGHLSPSESSEDSANKFLVSARLNGIQSDDVLGLTYPRSMSLFYLRISPGVPRYG